MMGQKYPMINSFWTDVAYMGHEKHILFKWVNKSVKALPGV